MLIKRNVLFSLHGAIGQLDARSKLIKENGGEREVMVPYSFSAITRMKLAKAIAAMQPVVEAYQKALTGIKAEEEAKSPAGENEAADVYSARIFKEVVKSAMVLVTQEEDVELPEFTIDEFRIETNEFPPSVLSALLPLIDE